MLRQQVRAELTNSRSVLVDASFPRRADRRAQAREALALNATVVFVECICDETTVLERLRTRWQKRLTGL
jgi:predicted kinase